MFQRQTFQPGTITSDMMRFTAQPVAQIVRLPGTPEPPRMFTDQLTGKQVTQAEVDSLGGMQTFLDPNAERARAKRVTAANLRHEQTIRGGNIGNLIGFSGPSGGQFGSPSIQPPQQLGGMFNQPQQRGGMFNQQNQFNPQGMQQMMQFMQQMMQMFSMMGGQNRGGGFGGGFGGQQQYQQPQRYQPQPRQQYQPPPRQQFQPVQQQYGQMGPQQPSPFAQSIRPRY